MIKIRNVQMDDCEALAIINQQSLNYEVHVEDVSRRLKQLLEHQDHQIYVCEWDEQVCGFIHVNHYYALDHDLYQQILVLGVHPQYQGKKIGHQLLEYAKEKAIQEGAVGFFLISGEDRKNAHAFYLKEGFTHRKNHLNFVKYF